MYSTEKDANSLDLQAESELKEKIRQEVQESIAQANRGELISIDEAFKSVLKAIEEK
jgi:hypothetical protein